MPKSQNPDKKTYLLVIDNFSGGLSDSDEIGIAGSFAGGKNLDIHSEPGILQLSQALKKDSASVVTDFVGCMVQVNDDIYALGSTGKVYKKTIGGSWALLFTNSNGNNRHGGAYYDDYLYYASTSKLGRYGPLSGTPSANDNYQTFKQGDNFAHPMVAAFGELYIGDGHYVAKYDGAVFDDDALILTPGYRVKSIDEVDSYLFIGTWKGTSLEKTQGAKIFVWDGVSDFYNSAKDLLCNGINAILNNFIFPGIKGEVGFFDNVQYQKVKQIKGDWKSTNSAQVYPYSVTQFRNMIHFGLSYIGGTNPNLGVYTYGSRDKNYSWVLNHEYAISTAAVASCYLGAILATGDDLYVAWRDGATYGIDIIDHANKAAAGYWESLIIDGGDREQKEISWIALEMYALPSGTSVAVKLKRDYASSWTTLKTISTANTLLVKVPVNLYAKAFQLRLDLNGSANYSPKIRRIKVKYDKKVLSL